MDAFHDHLQTIVATTMLSVDVIHACILNIMRLATCDTYQQLSESSVLTPYGRLVSRLSKLLRFFAFRDKAKGALEEATTMATYNNLYPNNGECCYDIIPRRACSGSEGVITLRLSGTSLRDNSIQRCRSFSYHAELVFQQPGLQAPLFSAIFFFFAAFVPESCQMQLNLRTY